jgi:hypothetical protein
MRNLFLVLVLTNLGFAAWVAWFAAPQSRGAVARDPAATGIMLVSELEDSALEAIEALAPVAPEFDEPPADPIDSVSTERCVSVGPFQELAQASAAQAALRAAGFMPNQRVIDGDVWVGYWVHLTDIPTRAAANEILELLRANDISDSYIVPGGEESQTISLGVFSEISRAANIREQVRALGYDPTVADRSRRATLYWIDVLAGADTVIDLDALQPAGRINRLEQRTCAAVVR